MRAAVCKRVALTEDGVVSPLIAWTVTALAGRTKSGKARVAPVVEVIARDERPGRAGGGGLRRALGCVYLAREDEGNYGRA